MTRTRQMLLRSRRVENFQLNRHLRGQKKKKEKKFIFNSNSKHRAETDFEDRPNTSERIPRVPSRFNYERNRSEQRSSTLSLPLLSSIVPHSDRHKVSSFVFVAESCEPNPSPARPLTTRMTDDERRRLIHIDSDIWIADTRILRHGTRFKPSSTRLPPSPARFERVRFVGAQKQGEETNGIERFLHIARLDGLPRAKPSFERHSSSLEEREWRKGEGSSLRAGISAGTGRSRGKESKSWSEFSTRFCSATATSRCGL